MDIVSLLMAFLPDIAKSIIHAIPNAIQKFRLKKFFGPSVLGDGNFWLVVDPYYHPLPRVGNRFIKHFLGRRADQPLIGEDRVLGSNVLRVLSYAASTIGHYRESNKPITFVADEDIENRWDGTMLCFGSSDSNVKTLDIESLPQNNLYRFKSDPTTGMRYFEISGRDFKITNDADIGIIFRIKNPRAPSHWLFICAGLGEWGTSGSSRYLFTHWQQVHKRFKNKNFVIAVAIRGKSDENAEELFSVSA